MRPLIEEPRAHPRSRGENPCSLFPVPWAHPRSRGENRRAQLRHVAAQGSSPLTRGKLGQPAHAHRPPGLIPAHAGKTNVSPAIAATSWAHPRSRGENWVCCSWHLRAQGSSPLTRGKRAGALTPGGETGLIPAHAGKTVGASRRSRCPRAHPRSRGENIQFGGDFHDGAGSSPLTRGKRTCPCRVRR